MPETGGAPKWEGLDNRCTSSSATRGTTLIKSMNTLHDEMEGIKKKNRSREEKCAADGKGEGTGRDPRNEC